MTARDFEAVARGVRALRQTLIADEALGVTDIDIVTAKAACEIARELAATNPRFDRLRFVNACMRETP
jgi:hypothetical protein